MARKINLQHPPIGKFGASCLDWDLIHDKRSVYTVMRLAYIPWERIPDFVEGEGRNEEFPTIFKKSTTHQRQPGSLKNPTESSWLMVTQYWCAFGPKDMRGHVKAPFDSSKIPKSGKGSRPNAATGQHMRGCQCHFVVKRLYLWPNIASIAYIHPHHTDESDVICHGRDYNGSNESHASLAPWVSMEMKTWVFNMLCKGFTPPQVIEEHNAKIHARQTNNPKHPLTRDDFLTIRDVLNIAKKLASEKYELHEDDAESTRMWALQNSSNTFIYQGEDNDSDQEFVLGIQTRWQLEQCNKYGNNGLVAMNSSFSMNKYKFHLYTILVFDSRRNGMPIAWIITSSTSSLVTELWLTKFRDRMLNYNKSWKPNAFMIDDAAAATSIRAVFNLPMFLCLWHVRRRWLKNLVSQVSDWPTRAMMLRKLGVIMNIQGSFGVFTSTQEDEILSIVTAFMDEFKDQCNFMAYFRSKWLDRIGMWVRVARTLPHANQDTNGAIESYHSTLKGRFLGGKRNIFVRRLDWLVHKLTFSCLPYYSYIEMLQDAEICKNEREVEHSIARAQAIPDDYVEFADDGTRLAFVQSVSNASHRNTVYNPGCEWACCTCDWAILGNVCKHQIKVMLVRGHTLETILSTCLQMYKENAIDSPQPGDDAPNDNGRSCLDSPQPGDDAPNDNRRSCSDSPQPGDDAPNDNRQSCEHALCVDDTLVVDDHTVNVDGVRSEIQAMFENALAMGGSDAFLLKYLKSYMERTLVCLHELKAKKDSTLLHPSVAFRSIEDSFGNTLERACPCIKKESSKKKRERQDDAKVEATNCKVLNV